MKSKFDEYIKLTNMTYDNAIKYLLKKYGLAQNDYFSEKSFNRFKRGEIKSISKGKISRTNEGLYCHHIDEDKFINLGNKDFIHQYNISFDTQRKEKLVYCNGIEHLILHSLIVKKNEFCGEFRVGIGGYKIMRPEFVDWFFYNELPSQNWRINCFNEINLTKDEFVRLIEITDDIVVENSSFVSRESLGELIYQKDYKKIENPFKAMKYIEYNTDYSIIETHFKNNKRVGINRASVGNHFNLIYCDYSHNIEGNPIVLLEKIKTWTLIINEGEKEILLNARNDTFDKCQANLHKSVYEIKHENDQVELIEKDTYKKITLRDDIDYYKYFDEIKMSNMFVFSRHLFKKWGIDGFIWYWCNILKKMLFYDKNGKLLKNSTIRRRKNKFFNDVIKNKMYAPNVQMKTILSQILDEMINIKDGFEN